LREVQSEKPNPKRFPPLLKGEGKGIMFLAGRGVKNQSLSQE
jgi:hypothetical protein